MKQKKMCMAIASFAPKLYTKWFKSERYIIAAALQIAMNSHTTPIHVLHISSFKSYFPNSASFPSFKPLNSTPLRKTAKHHLVQYHRERTRTRATLDERDQLSSTSPVIEDEKPKRVLSSFPLYVHFALLPLMFSKFCLVSYKIEKVKMLKFESLVNPFHLSL